MLKVSRPNSLILKEKNIPRRSQIRAKKGTFNFVSEREQKVRASQIQPELFINFIPVIQVQEWSQATKTMSENNIKNSIQKLENIIQKSTVLISSLQKEVSELIEQSPQLSAHMISYRGRGLKEYRKKFFLILYHHSLCIKTKSLEIKEHKELIEICESMLDFLRRPIDLHDILVSVDIDGYLNARISSEAKIAKMQKKAHILDTQKIQWPSFVPPPDDFVLQLIYPTSDTVSIFINMANNAQTKSIEKIYKEFKEMTDDNEEMEILLDHAFDFGWQKTDFPYLCMKPTKIPLFLNVTPRALNVEYVPAEYMSIKINELQGMNWPYASVVVIMQSMLFETSPFRMAKVFNDALNEITKCVNNVNGKPVSLEFDQVFSISVLCLMVSGVLAEERVLLYISQLSLIDIDDMQTRIGATYAASALNHILSLEEEELVYNS